MSQMSTSTSQQCSPLAKDYGISTLDFQLLNVGEKRKSQMWHKTTCIQNANLLALRNIKKTKK